MKTKLTEDPVFGKIMDVGHLLMIKAHPDTVCFNNIWNGENQTMTFLFENKPEIVVTFVSEIEFNFKVVV